MKVDVVALIKEVIKSEDFKKELVSISNHFVNLKQECLIRDAILKQLNDQFLLKNGMRAFAEYPRIRGRRIDLCIINKDETLPFLVELKFQFTKDYKSFTQSSFTDLIKSDYELEKTTYGKVNLFILIVCHWDKQKRELFLKQWLNENTNDLSTSLNQYISDDNKNWQNNLKEVWMYYASTSEKIEPLSINIAEPFDVHYHFYLLSRKRN